MKNQLRDILEKLAKGEINVEQALEKLKFFPYEDLEFAKVDHHRFLRRDFPEVIFGPGKTDEQIISIAKKISEKEGNLLITKVSQSVYEKVKEIFPDAKYNSLAKLIYVKRDTSIKGKGKILVITAGTSDIPVAEEAYLTADVMGNKVEKIYDVGVAGLHRLFGEYEKVKEARVIICVAGMEGALPSVIAGITSVPIIAVPTSVGYGASFHGLSALLAMLNSCPGGVAVVNIDNGFGAAYLASMINRL
ncbi:nickel pincer cofactor biosynthesis protein LarB [Candidatus Aminicenantes bacterium AC-335-A11]|jgi:hypothetical protein|nr:nickel pincer cofactor biosynthesis protein LarB [SCandidatus Aminicenantes bacterium Aminicenantia_JdfR_composite]MCP2617929.1 nickel pincer cofactor biosynthesis protein LarB [Candidatus Aminicenantes bacterium AC-335-A11]